MPSILDLAVLAEDVYSDDGNALAKGHGWQRLDCVRWGEGFAAGTYQKKDGVVVAYRGTDDASDAVSDARMIPLLQQGATNRTLETLLRQYGITDSRVSVNLAKGLVAFLLESRLFRTGIQVAANRVPAGQSKQALDYFDNAARAPQFVVGHSLGGALAKVVSDRRSARAVAFNSPFMGDLTGTIQHCSSLILNVNSIGDPLSLATRAAGNLPHGATIQIPIAPFGRKPPKVQAVRRRHECGWRDVIRGGVGGYVGCRTASELKYRTRQIGEELEYFRTLLDFLKAAALHYHSISNLRKALEGRPACRAQIGDTF